MAKELFNDLKELVTEASNPASEDIDNKTVREILEVINAEDQTIPGVVNAEIPFIAEAVKIIVAALEQGGRLFYVGAGTSGRLGVLDASECPPTYGTDPETVQGIMAGGAEALVRSVEGIEDNKEQGVSDLMARGLNAKDVVCGIAASRRTPYVVAAVKKAREIGAKTLYVTCNPRSMLDLSVDVSICPVVGPEVIMGSTRMKAGTATKMILNMLTTATMIKLGKVYGNMMVDLMMTSKKLEERSKRTVMMVTGLNYSDAAQVLQKASGHVKTALVMTLADIQVDEAQKRLLDNNGVVRNAIA